MRVSEHLRGQEEFFVAELSAVADLWLDTSVPRV